MEEIEALNLREYLYSSGVSLIEWFDFLPAAEADEFLEIRLAHAGPRSRELSFAAHGVRYESLIEKLRTHTKAKV